MALSETYRARLVRALPAVPNPYLIRHYAGRAMLYALVAVLLCFFLGPFVWLSSTAFKPSHEIFQMPPRILPETPTLENFRRALFEFPFPLYLRNTLIITLLSTAGCTFSSAMVGFSLAHLRWPDRQVVFICLLGTMMIPMQILLIPHFLMFRTLGWVDTFLPLIIPPLLGTAFDVFLFRQFFRSIPTSLIESAQLDGARSFRIFLQIVMPLSKPVITTVLILTSVHAWNDFMGPLIYLSSESTKTLAVGLADMRGQFTTDWGMLMASALMMSLPVIALFFVAQKAFIEGISMSGVKG